VTKKVLSVVLLLCFLIALIQTPVFAAETTADTVEDEIRLLSSLGIIDSDIVSDVNPSKSIKRGEFASLICSYAGITALDSDESLFSDVPEDHKYCPSINTVSKYGFMSGVGDGRFNPDSAMSYVQIYKVVLSLIGYGEIAQNYGGYPMGYVTLASKTDINRSVKISDYNADAKWGDVLKILVDTLDVRVVRYTGLDGEDLVLSTDANETVLDFYHGIKTGEGTVRATQRYQAADIEPLEYNEILIGDVIYKIQNGKNYDSYFGYGVRFYCNDKNTIVHVDDYYNSNNVTIVESEDISGFDGSVFKYYDEDKERKISVSLSTDILYNGRKALGLTDNDFTKSGTTLKFIDSGDDGSIDILDISYCEICVVKAVSLNKEVIYDMYNGGSISLKGVDNLIFLDEFGNKMDISELSEYDVLSVYQTKDKKITQITYSNKETEGTITETNLPGKVVKIDGFEYEIANSFMSNVSQLELGQSGLFPLDHEGRIAAYKPYQNSYKYAYFINALTTSGLDGKTCAKMFTQDGEMLVVEVCDKIILDGESTDGNNLVSYLDNGNGVEPQLVRYYLKSGQLKAVDTLKKAGGGVDDSVSVLHSSSTQLMYNAYQYIFGARVPISPSVCVFVIPEDIENDDGYAIRTRSVYTHDRTYSINAYVSKEGGQIADAIVKSGSVTKIDSESPVFVIDCINNIIDNDGVHTYCLYGFIDGHEAEYVLKDESVLHNVKSISDTSKNYTLKCGDVVRLGKDGVTGKIEEIELFYEKENDYIKNDIDVATNLTSSNRMFRANVYSNSEGIVRLTKNPLEDSGIELGMMDYEAVAIEKYAIYMYTTERGKPKVTLASASDIADYLSVGSDFSKVLVFSPYTNPGTIIITNN